MSLLLNGVPRRMVLAFEKTIWLMPLLCFAIAVFPMGLFIFVDLTVPVVDDLLRSLPWWVGGVVSLVLGVGGLVAASRFAAGMEEAYKRLVLEERTEDAF